MAGVKKVFGDKGFAIKAIADRVHKWYELQRCIERHQRNGNKPARLYQYKAVQKRYKYFWTLNTSDHYQ